MRLEKEQGYLKADRWYYDYTEDNLIDLMKRYPYIPFNIDNGRISSCQIYYRWNEKLNIIEYRKTSIKGLDCWEKGKLKDFVGTNKCYCFIVFKEALTSYLYRGNGELEIIINNAYQDLVPRKNTFQVNHASMISSFN